MAFSRSELRSYLLGTIDPDREEAIDRALLDDDQLDESLAVAEALLIDDHLAGSLDAGEARAFRETYLTSPERVRKIQQIRDLSLIAGSRSTSSDVTEMRPAKFVPNRSSRYSFGWLRPLAFGLVLVAVVGAVYVLFRDRPTGRSLDSEYAKMNSDGIRDTDISTGTARIDISPGLTRSSSALPRVSRSTPNVLLSMALPWGVTVKGKLTAEVVSAKDGSFSFQVGRPLTLKEENVVRVLLPGNILREGQTEIILSGEDSKIIGKYYLDVVP